MVARSTGDPWTFGGQLNPQLHSSNGGLPYRTETGPALLEAFQGFIGQTSVFQWGKKSTRPARTGASRASSATR